MFKHRLNQKGTLYVSLVIILVIAGIVACGYYLYAHTTHRSEKKPVDIVAESDQNNFASCVRSGGEVRPRPYVNVDIAPAGAYTDGLHCFRDQNASADTADVIICSDKNAAECRYINSATYELCEHMFKSTFGIDVPQGKAYLKERKYSLVSGDYAKVDALGCGLEGSDMVTPGFTAFYHYSGRLPWTEIVTVVGDITCNDIDGRGIPLDLVYVCKGADTKLRIPKP